MPRDRVSEIREIRQRLGRGGAPSGYDLEELTRLWEARLKDVKLVDEMLPIRIVTILEVFVRSWIERLVDHGAPYVERAANLKIDLKYDFAVVRSLHGGIVTLGQIIAHSVKVNRFASIVAIFDSLLNESLIAAISDTRDRWAVEVMGQPDQPIIQDMNELRKTLGRLFEVRHILAHEVPRKKPVQPSEILVFLRAATQFVKAVDEMLYARLQGKYALTQREMNQEAAAGREEAEKELEALCLSIAEEYESATIYEVQSQWKAFQEAEATRRAESFKGGSMWPMVYASEAAALARGRIDDLKRWAKDAQLD